MKQCYKCKELKPLDQYHRDKNKAGGHVGVCKVCANKRVKEWAKENPDKLKIQWTKARYSRYGITEEQFKQILEKQGNVCAICKETGADNVDHNHECCPPKKSRACGKCVRGILCNRCNLAIGHLRNRIDLASSLIKYLSKQPGLV